MVEFTSFDTRILFVIFVGEGASRIKDATPIVYDMKNNQWTTQFNRFIKVTSTTTGPTKETPPPNSTPTSQSDSPTKIAAIGGGIGGVVVVVIAVAGFLLYRRRRRQKTRTKNGRHQDQDEDEEGVGLARRQKPPPNNNDDIEANRLAVSYTPPRDPSPPEGRHALLNRFSISSPTEISLAGPHAVPRDPQGHQPQPQQQSKSTNNGGKSGRVDANNEAHHQVILLPGRPSSQSDNTDSAGIPQSSRNPQSLNSYEERAQELMRMIANLQAEQEELRRISVRR